VPHPRRLLSSFIYISFTRALDSKALFAVHSFSSKEFHYMHLTVASKGLSAPVNWPKFYNGLKGMSQVTAGKTRKSFATEFIQ
jgi:hypothetical protein